MIGQYLLAATAIAVFLLMAWCIDRHDQAQREQWLRELAKQRRPSTRARRHDRWEE